MWFGGQGDFNTLRADMRFIKSNLYGTSFSVFCNSVYCPPPSQNRTGGRPDRWPSGLKWDPNREALDAYP